MAFLSIHYIYFSCLISGAALCDMSRSFNGVKARGDIIIGGLFPVHEKVIYTTGQEKPEPLACEAFDIAGFSGVLSMIYAIEMINNSSLLGDIRLGYEIYDTCAEVTTAVRATMNFIVKSNSSKDCLEPECTNSEYIPKVKAVVGASYSENSMAVARVLNLLLMTQVSYSSSAEILSDKVRFPAFLRTVPKDSYQTRAIAKLVKRSGWNWVGTIATDDDYGQAAIDSFISQATELNICIAFKQIIPAYLSDKTIDKRINETIKTLYKETKVKVIVVFAKPKHMIKLFSFLDKAAMSKIWIASDSWSTSSEVAKFPGIKDVKNIIGFMFKGGNLTSFSNFLKNLPTNEEYLNENVFLKEFMDLLPSCLANSTNSSNCLLNFKVGASEDERDILMKNFRPGIAYRTLLAVVAIANGIRDFYTREEYQNSTDFPPWKLLESIKNVTFTYEGQNISFDSSGDTNLGYQIVMWKTGNETLNLQNVVAEYDIENDALIFKSNETEKQIDSLKNIVSNCSDTCNKGQFKKTAEGQHTCCYECINCTENQYSNNTDMDQCLSCDTNKEWSSPGSARCSLKSLEYFTWDNGFAIVLLVLASLGAMFVIVTTIIFVRCRDTPIVKASGGTICYVILFCLLCSFFNSGLFVGKPCDILCKIRQMAFGLSFTCCVSCILVKSLKIILAFNFNPSLQNILRKAYKPVLIIVCCTGIQIIICITWLIIYSPHEERVPMPNTILLQCNEGSNVVFGLMLGYIALLAMICFICAFKGRKLPENYNEAKFITFGMLIYFIAWVIFVPIYVTTKGKYLQAVEMVVILISNYGILCCHFFPKCYVILFKKDHNTKDAFLQKIFEYSSRSASRISACSILSTDSLSSPKTLMFYANSPSQVNSDRSNIYIFESCKEAIGKEKDNGRLWNRNKFVRRKRMASV
uniref:G-protein coupled receptor family C group 6 member A n=1 Tax=Erpetoichthys calabaricus TaxID=27687 RepID=A0A8C4RMZ9_ERPCA